MNRYENLKKLYSEIELLESAGLHKAASVLHKKFVKEAQAKDAFMGLVTQDAKNFMMELDKAYREGQSTLSVIQRAERAGLSPQELQILKNHANKIKNQASIQNPYAGYQTPENNAGPQGTAYFDAEANVTNTQVSDSAMSQPQATSGDTANEMQAQNSMPAEAPIYQQAINQIANLLKTRTPMNRTIAQSIYENTITKFKDQKRKEAFGRQYQRLVSTYFPQTRPVK